MEVPLPWERLLWSGRSLSFRRARYMLTDFRLVSIAESASTELAIYDIGDIRRVAAPLDRLLGTSTLIVRARDTRRPSLLLHRIRRGEQLAALLELLANDRHVPVDAGAVRAALLWKPRGSASYRNSLVGVAAVLIAVFGVAIGLHGTSTAVIYPPEDAIYPGGEKRDREAIVRFMESSVMPWARTTLGPLVGGPDRVACGTCHGERPALQQWQMPGVAALPKPDVADRGWEQYSSTMDAQMRNAIYGYVAESDNQARAKYMREVVMPGMARLLKRPAYDFTKSYEYNRTHFAFGCYHCHQVAATRH
jgi:hypothetical protein